MTAEKEENLWRSPTRDSKETAFHTPQGQQNGHMVATKGRRACGRRGRWSTTGTGGRIFTLRIILKRRKFVLGTLRLTKQIGGGKKHMFGSNVTRGTLSGGKLLLVAQKKYNIKICEKKIRTELRKL